MFDKIKRKIKGVIHKVNGSTTILEALGTSPATSQVMRDNIALWADMYMNKAWWTRPDPAPDLDDPIEVVSIGLPAAIASEKARMACLELKSEITSKNTARGEFLDKSYQDGIISEIRKQAEYAIAKGGLAITPYVIRDEGTAHFAFDFTQADRFIPIGFDTSGKITDAAFLIRKDTVDYIYFRLERQQYSNGVLTITNRAFRRAANTATVYDKDIYNVVLGTEINLADVPEWASLEPELGINNVDRVMFAYIKMPCANTIDINSPLGISGYSKAVDLIHQADIMHARLEWEMKAGMLRIDIDSEAIKDADGNSLKDRIPAVFRTRDTNDLKAYNVYAPNLRVEEYKSALDELLARIEDSCALSRGTLSRSSEQARTATELKILRQRTYSENADIQQAIQKALEDVVYIMNAYCDIYPDLVSGNGKATENAVVSSSDNAYDVSFEWDDSIIVDRETELQQRLTLMDRGIAGRVENRMWYYGETEEQAIEALKKIDEENKMLAGEKLDNIGAI